MRQTNHLNKNRQFLIGVVALAICVTAVVILFITLAFGKMEEKPKHEKQYRIDLCRGFKGDSIMLMLNDSLLLDGPVEEDSMHILIVPFAENNMISLGDRKSGRSINMNISKESGIIELNRTQDGMVSLMERDW